MASVADIFALIACILEPQEYRFAPWGDLKKPSGTRMDFRNLNQVLSPWGDTTQAELWFRGIKDSWHPLEVKTDLARVVRQHIWAKKESVEISVQWPQVEHILADTNDSS